MNKLSTMFKTIKDNTKSSILRFPGTILCLLVIYTLMDIQRYTKVSFDDKLLIILAYGVFAAFLVETMLENLKQTNIRFKLICYFLAYIILQVSYFYLPLKMDKNVFIFAALLAMSVFMLYNKERGHFGSILAQLIVSQFIAFIFASVICLGLVSIFGSIELLLFKISNRVYEESLQISYLIVFPMMFLSGLPKMGQNVEYPSFLKKLIRFVIIPLLLAVTAVLYAYYGKLVLTSTLPIEEVLEITLSFLGLALPTLILITPFEEKLLRHIRTWGIFLLVPVVFVLVFAAICNIRDIGVTYMGYLSLMSALFSIIAIVLIKIKDAKYQHNLFLVLAVLSIVCGFGAINMFRLTTISQQNILTSTLKKNDMLEGDKIVPNSSIAMEDKKKILSSINYLIRKGLDVPQYYDKENGNYEEIFGFSMYAQTNSKVKLFKVNNDDVLNIQGYEYYIRDLYNDKFIQTDKGMLKIQDVRGKVVKIYLDDQLLSEMNYNDICDEVYNRLKLLDKEVFAPDEMSYVYNSDKINLKIIFGTMEYMDDKHTYSSYGMLLNILEQPIEESIEE